jgi:hypothetical protein
MDAILTFLSGSVGAWAMGIVGAVSIGTLLDKLLKKYIKQSWLDKIRDGIRDIIASPGKAIGLAIDAGGKTLPVVGKFWNKTIEPWVIIFLETIGRGITSGFNLLVTRIVRALQSDNPSVMEDPDKVVCAKIAMSIWTDDEMASVAMDSEAAMEIAQIIQRVRRQNKK